MPAEFRTVAQASEIRDGEGFPVELDGVPIAIFRVDGQYFAVADCCPHQGAPLCDGAVVGRSVACSWHGWRFDLETGKRLDASRGQIPTYSTRLVGEEVQVALAG